MDRRIRHGFARRSKMGPTYRSWAAMRQRCLDVNHEAYKNYGGRGITICIRWNRFENFLADMGERPTGKTLDRKNNNGNYTPRNCRWATRTEQTQNSRKNVVNQKLANQIRKLARKMKQVKIAARFGISPVVVGQVVRNEIWKQKA